MNFISGRFTIKENTIVLTLVCPILWILSKHCHSLAGFQAGSRSRRWLAAVRLSPTPPALRLSSNILGELRLLDWKVLRLSALLRGDIPPSSRVKETPESFSLSSGCRMERKEVN